eukprot:PhM_4_TR8467/c5_g1_i2/m.47134
MMMMCLMMSLKSAPSHKTRCEDEAVCVELGVKPSDTVRKLLPTRMDDLTVLSFEESYVGAKQLLPLLHVVTHAKNLKEINLDGMKLTNEHVFMLCRHVENCKQLEVISLRNNPQVSISGGKALFHAACVIKSLREVRLDGTLVLEAQKKKIAAQLEVNWTVAMKLMSNNNNNNAAVTMSADCNEADKHSAIDEGEKELVAAEAT